jgi:hypothetical protein
MEPTNLNKFVFESDDYKVQYESCSLNKILEQFNGDKDNGRIIFRCESDIQYGYISAGKFEEYEEKFQ